jgi:hypothetical protein
MDTNKIKDKIKKLLNLANDDNAFDGEVDNALRFARRLMLRHNVSQEDLEEAKDPHEVAADAEEVEYGKTVAYTTGTRLSQWESTLSAAICELLGTVQHYRTSNEVRMTSAGTVSYDKDGYAQLATGLHFYGPEEDTRDAKDLFVEWSHVIVTMARMKYGGAFKGSGREYAEGFASALYSKVENIKREEKRTAELPETTRCTALMIRNAGALMQAKRERASSWLRDVQGIRLRSGGSRYRNVQRDPGARAAGRSDGSRADFSHSRKKKLT